MSTEIQPFLRVMLDASFAHVPQHELEALKAMAWDSDVRIGNFHGQVTWGEFNALVHLGAGLDLDATQEEIDAAWDWTLVGVSEGLAGLIRMAIAHGAEWLNLDQDGQRYDLPMYDGNERVTGEGLRRSRIGGYVVVRVEDQEIRDAYKNEADAWASAEAMSLEDDQPYTVHPADLFLFRNWESWCWLTEECLVNGQIVELAVADRSP